MQIREKAQKCWFSHYISIYQRLINILQYYTFTYNKENTIVIQLFDDSSFFDALSAWLSLYLATHHQQRNWPESCGPNTWISSSTVERILDSKISGYDLFFCDVKHIYFGMKLVYIVILVDSWLLPASCSVISLQSVVVLLCFVFVGAL